MAEKTCQESTGDTWSRSVCGRPFKTDEQRDASLCGRHLAAKKRRDATDARIKADIEARFTASADARRLAAQLKDSLGDDLRSVGITASADGVLLDPGAARAVLERLKR